MLLGNLTMVMIVKITEKSNGAKKTEIIMAWPGKKNGRTLKSGPIVKEERPWTALNAAVKQV